MVTDLCSIGTLFAFVVVCAGVLVLQNKPNVKRGKLKTPYLNSKFIAPTLSILFIIYSFTYNKENTIHFLSNNKEINSTSEILIQISDNKMAISF